MESLMCIAAITWAVHAPETPGETAKLIPSPESLGIGSPADSQVVPLAKDDPCYEAVAGQVREAKENIARGGLMYAQMHGPPWEIKGRAIARLFPKHRFFGFVWSEKLQDPQAPSRVGGLLWNARLVFAIDNNGAVHRFRNYWSPSLSGEFLAKNRVKIRNAEDARLVWDVVCEIFRRERKGEIERVSDHLWRLGIEKTGRGVGHYEVQLNADFSVKSINYAWEESP